MEKKEFSILDVLSQPTDSTFFPSQQTFQPLCKISIVRGKFEEIANCYVDDCPQKIEVLVETNVHPSMLKSFTVYARREKEVEQKKVELFRIPDVQAGRGFEPSGGALPWRFTYRFEDGFPLKSGISHSPIRFLAEAHFIMDPFSPASQQDAIVKFQSEEVYSIYAKVPEAFRQQVSQERNNKRKRQASEPDVKVKPNVKISPLQPINTLPAAPIIPPPVASLPTPAMMSQSISLQQVTNQLSQVQQQLFQQYQWFSMHQEKMLQDMSAEREATRNVICHQNELLLEKVQQLQMSQHQQVGVPPELLGIKSRELLHEVIMRSKITLKEHQPSISMQHTEHESPVIKPALKRRRITLPGYQQPTSRIKCEIQYKAASHNWQKLRPDMFASGFMECAQQQELRVFIRNNGDSALYFFAMLWDENNTIKSLYPQPQVPLQEVSHSPAFTPGITSTRSDWHHYLVPNSNNQKIRMDIRPKQLDRIEANESLSFKFIAPATNGSSFIKLVVFSVSQEEFTLMEKRTYSSRDVEQTWNILTKALLVTSAREQEHEEQVLANGKEEASSRKAFQVAHLSSLISHA